MIRTRKFQNMFAILFVSLCLYGFSILINPGYPEVYTSAIILFISRLWPAYYIGRYTEDWGILCKSVLLYSPIALIYAVSLFVMPELTGGSAYATIASNLAYVSMIALFASLYYKKRLWLPVSLICLVPVFFYGTRVFFFGVLLSLFLSYIIHIYKSSLGKSIVLFITLAIIAILFLLFSQGIFDQLYQWFPDSRTLKMMAVGDLFDDSNRSLFYTRIYTHLKENPLSMLGLMGDRIFLSPPEANSAEILSEFSHNCSLELCMNFGVPIGIILNVYFVIKLSVALRRCFLEQNVVNYVYVLMLGVVFLNMMISVSYLSEYTVWLLFGLAFNICHKPVYSK